VIDGNAMRPGLLFLIPFIVLLSSRASEATEITGRVVGIADGDILTILDSSKQQHRIRLAFVDAPRKNGQPY
jgi:endonuclease YncB( thermonuclease family)